MPKITIAFPDETSIPKELTAYKTADNKVEMWVGDKVAEETNPSLAANSISLLNEKKVLQGQYDSLIQTSSKQNETINDLNMKLTSGQKITPDEVALLPKVKALTAVYGTLDEVETKLKDYTTIQPEYVKVTTRLTNDEVFQASGFKSRTAFDEVISNPTKMTNIDKMYVETVKDANQKDVKVAYADRKKADGSIEKVQLSELPKSDWSFYANSLMEVDNSKKWLPQDTSNPTPPIQNGQVNSAVGNFIGAMNAQNSAKKS